MSIVKMKRLYAIVPTDSKRAVLRSLYRFGCVELESGTEALLAGYDGLLQTKEESTGAAETKSQLVQAIAALDRYAPQKKSLLSARRTVTETQFFDQAVLARAADAAQKINGLVSKMDENAASEARLSTRIASLTPWEGLDVELSYEGGPLTAYLPGVMPSAANITELMTSFEEQGFACQLELVGTDREQHYLTLLSYRRDAEEALSWLKQHGFMAVSFKGTSGTAAENIAACRGDISALQADSTRCIEAIRSFAGEREALETAFDVYTQEAGQDGVLSGMAQTKNTVVLVGWLPAAAADAVGAALDAHGCAWELEDPKEGDDVPVSMQNGNLVDPVVSVTEMYGSPAYDSIVDPNPAMFPFYVTFFGFIMADAAYGILMFVGCLAALRLMRPKGGMKRMLTLFMYCGIATFIAGALTGGWFADVIYQFSSTFLGRGVSIPPLWFDPLQEPMKMLAFSMALGGIQIITGMGIAAYRMIRRGDLVGAICDIFSWYLVFAGIGLFVLGIQAGMYVAIAGVAILLLTGGRDKKGIFGKITGGLGKIYNVTGYVSDLLSYSRIMALGLSGAVVGQVMNKMAVMGGSGIVGILLFVFVFLIGHSFNLVISLLGAYVHTSRLQYIEFFGRFFEEGGRPFRPLVTNTKYVDIIKED